MEVGRTSGRNIVKKQQAFLFAFRHLINALLPCKNWYELNYEWDIKICQAQGKQTGRQKPSHRSPCEQSHEKLETNTIVLVI